MTLRRRVLRAYPPDWRARYGDELDALIDDTVANQAPTARLWFDLAAAGLAERRRVFVARTRSAGEQRIRAAGGLVVIGGALFVLAGCAFAKRAEHQRATGWVTATAVLAILAGIVVLVAVAVAGRSVLRHWPGASAQLRRRCRRALAAAGVALAAGAGLVVYASQLTPHERELGSVRYDQAFLAAAIAVVAAVAAWAVVAWTACREVPMPPRLLAIEARLAAIIPVAMLAMTSLVVGWWWTLGGAAPGSLAVIVGAMVIADVVGSSGLVLLRRNR